MKHSQLMRFGKFNFLILNLSLILFSCKTEEEKVNLTYDNIIIFSDMSNRLNNGLAQNLPANDTILINKISDFFVSNCVQPGVKTNDRSSNSFSFLNPINYRIIKPKIDLEEEFPKSTDIGKKQAYVNSTCKNKNLNSDIKLFKNSIKKVYKNYQYFTNKYGLDVINIINEKISNSNIIKQKTTILGENDTTNIKYENHLIIFTDGYLEYDLRKADPSRYFGVEKINQIRNFCRFKGCTPEVAITEFHQPKLPKHFSKINQNVSIYILETNDRNLDKNTGSNKYGSGLTDNDILKIVWKYWAKESGFKKFVWQKINLNKNEIDLNYVNNLLRNKKGFE